MEDEKESKVWIGKDGIIRMRLGININEDIVYSLVKNLKQVIESVPKKRGVLVDISSSAPIPATAFRKRVADIITDTFKGTEYKRMAVFGASSTVQKVVALFILKATGLKNIEYFTNEREALEWLKQD